LLLLAVLQRGRLFEATVEGVDLAVEPDLLWRPSVVEGHRIVELDVAVEQNRPTFDP
jgi:hypothetical protein